jgi:hypothetical protein
MTSPADDMRIGGEFELNPASLNLSADRPLPTLPSTFSYWTDTGRSALLLAARDLLRRGGKPVAWLPAFCCHSVLQAFEQAGFTVHYYSAAELHGEETSPPDPQPGETLLFVHYFGHRNRQRLAQVSAWQRAGIYIVEDAVQAALTQGVGASGHYAVTSLRKFLPQPDGALIGSRQAFEFTLADPDEAFVSAKALAKLMRGASAAPEAFLPLIELAESRLDDSAISPRQLSWLSRQLMLRTDLVSVAATRRVNCQSLYDAVRTELRPGVVTLITEVHEGEVPLGLPIRVSDERRDELRRFLAQHSVFCPIHWRLPHVPKTPALAADHRLADDVLTLPIDQRMNDLHIRRVVELLQQFFMES